MERDEGYREVTDSVRVRQWSKEQQVLVMDVSPTQVESQSRAYHAQRECPE